MSQIVCRGVQRDRSPIKFNTVEIAFVLAISNWLNQLPTKPGGEGGEGGEGEGGEGGEGEEAGVPWEKKN